jgi:rSAM/selenodomain-associated transferase 2
MRFSIIMPVLNEEAVLEKQLIQLRKQCAGFAYQLLIVDGGSQDSTVAIAKEYGHVVYAPRGRASQMNTGAAAADGDVFIFLHADTHLPADALQMIEQALQTPMVVGGAFRISFDVQHWSYRLVAFTANLRSQLFTRFTGDQTYFVRAASFRAIDGYPEQPLMEDLEIIDRLRTIGRVILLPQYVITSARRHERIGLLRSVLFMWYLRVLYKFGTSPARLQRMYADIR